MSIFLDEESAAIIAAAVNELRQFDPPHNWRARDVETFWRACIKEINRRIPNTHLVMHGSSSVPQDLLQIIRENGGEMKETYGVPVEEIQEGIKHGVRKVNIDTDIRLAMTAAIRKYMNANKSAFDPRDYLKPARAAAKEICKQRYQQFGCAGQGSKLQPVPLEKMATRYAKGELAAVVN